MAQDLTTVKSNIATRVSQLAGQLLVLQAQIQETTNEYFQFGFNGAGTNPIVQADLVGSNAFLTPTVVTNIISNFQTLNTTLTATILNNLRLGISSPLQGGG